MKFIVQCIVCMVDYCSNVVKIARLFCCQYTYSSLVCLNVFSQRFLLTN